MQVSIHSFLKINTMGGLLYIIAIILVIAWALLAFSYDGATGLIHAAFVLAIIALLLQVIRRGHKESQLTAIAATFANQQN